MSADALIDRSQGFEPDHTFEHAYDTATKSVYVCDGSCGIEGCTEKRTFPKMD